MKTDETKKARVIYPEYWAKRKKRLNAGFIKMLEETAQKEAECSDEYGEYKTGTFLYKSAIVSVRRENDLWTLHMMSEVPIGLPLIKEIRYKFLPDNLLMAQLYAPRKDASEMKGVILYEIPNNQENEVAE